MSFAVKPIAFGLPTSREQRPRTFPDCSCMMVTSGLKSQMAQSISDPKLLSAAE